MRKRTIVERQRDLEGVVALLMMRSGSGGSSPMLLLWGMGEQAANGVRYLSPGGYFSDAAADPIRLVVPVACTLQSMAITAVEENQHDGTPQVFTVNVYPEDDPLTLLRVVGRAHLSYNERRTLVTSSSWDGVAIPSSAIPAGSELEVTSNAAAFAQAASAVVVVLTLVPA